MDMGKYSRREFVHRHDREENRGLSHLRGRLFFLFVSIQVPAVLLLTANPVMGAETTVQDSSGSPHSSGGQGVSGGMSSPPVGEGLPPNSQSHRGSGSGESETTVQDSSGSPHSSGGQGVSGGMSPPPVDGGLPPNSQSHQDSGSGKMGETKDSITPSEWGDQSGAHHHVSRDHSQGAVGQVMDEDRTIGAPPDSGKDGGKKWKGSDGDRYSQQNIEDRKEDDFEPVGGASVGSRGGARVHSDRKGIDPLLQGVGNRNKRDSESTGGGLLQNQSRDEYGLPIPITKPDALLEEVPPRKNRERKGLNDHVSGEGDEVEGDSDLLSSPIIKREVQKDEGTTLEGHVGSESRGDGGEIPWYKGIWNGLQEIWYSSQDEINDFADGKRREIQGLLRDTTTVTEGAPKGSYLHAEKNGYRGYSMVMKAAGAIPQVFLYGSVRFLLNADKQIQKWILGGKEEKKTEEIAMIPEKFHSDRVFAQNFWDTFRRAENKWNEATNAMHGHTLGGKVFIRFLNIGDIFVGELVGAIRRLVELGMEGRSYLFGVPKAEGDKLAQLVSEAVVQDTADTALAYAAVSGLMKGVSFKSGVSVNSIGKVRSRGIGSKKVLGADPRAVSPSVLAERLARIDRHLQNEPPISTARLGEVDRFLQNNSTSRVGAPARNRSLGVHAAAEGNGVAKQVGNGVGKVEKTSIPRSSVSHNVSPSVVEETATRFRKQPGPNTFSEHIDSILNENYALRRMNNFGNPTFLGEKIGELGKFDKVLHDIRRDGSFHRGDGPGRAQKYADRVRNTKSIMKEEAEGKFGLIEKIGTEIDEMNKHTRESMSSSTSRMRKGIEKDIVLLGKRKQGYIREFELLNDYIRGIENIENYLISQAGESAGNSRFYVPHSPPAVGRVGNNVKNTSGGIGSKKGLGSNSTLEYIDSISKENLALGYTLRKMNNFDNPTISGKSRMASALNMFDRVLHDIRRDGSLYKENGYGKAQMYVGIVKNTISTVKGEAKGKFKLIKEIETKIDEMNKHTKESTSSSTSRMGKGIKKGIVQLEKRKKDYIRELGLLNDHIRGAENIKNYLISQGGRFVGGSRFYVPHSPPAISLPQNRG
ncbi:hypothetical protein [Pasteuria penetrans]|uniref:hypothetical protein n=1 Tax=Pasteuria penetrans TaxID=86005 RepID=UPI0011EF0FB6|nr:hypothetical protein [Pasteuria penetrans]